MTVPPKKQPGALRHSCCTKGKSRPPHSPLRKGRGPCVAEVDESLCLGCGACADACPQEIIHLHDPNCPMVVKCSNRDPGKVARTACQVSCIGCGICEKVCPSGAAKVADDLSSIDESLCLSCGMCAVKCPRHAIYDLRGVLTAKR